MIFCEHLSKVYAIPTTLPLHPPRIFQIIYHSGGGFVHSDLYTMPIYLRNFYYNELVTTRKKENEEIRKANQKSKPKMNPRFKR